MSLPIRVGDHVKPRHRDDPHPDTGVVVSKKRNGQVRVAWEEARETYAEWPENLARCDALGRLLPGALD